ncbi:mas-related G-protein coupled receptor member X2 [Vulpes vulpes]|uniref:Mas-related G-protein coupled receptor member X2 n=1 Tax=Vulpes vulpes TaxID=9627 RepID=A0ABM4XZR8_VULVU
MRRAAFPSAVPSLEDKKPVKSAVSCCPAGSNYSDSGVHGTPPLSHHKAAIVLTLQSQSSSPGGDEARDCRCSSLFCVPRNTSGGFLSIDPTDPTWESTFTPKNASDQPFLQTPNVQTVIMASLSLTFALGGLAGNMIVLWFLGFRMRRNAFSVYILNLAGADFLYLSFQTVYSLEQLVNFHSMPLVIPNFFTTVWTLAYIASLSILSAISLERCLSALCPIWYRCHRPKHTSAVMCALLWALSLLLSILEGQYCGFLFLDLDYDWCRAFDFITATWLIFLFVLLSGSSLAMLTRLCGSQRVPLTRLYMTVVLTVLAFLLCGLPFGIHWFLLFWIQMKSHVILSHLYLVALVLSSVNSCANPIIYFFVGSFRQRWPRRQKTLKMVLQRALQDVTGGDDSEVSSPQEHLEMSRNSLVF